MQTVATTAHAANNPSLDLADGWRRLARLLRFSARMRARNTDHAGAHFDRAQALAFELCADELEGGAL